MKDLFGKVLVVSAAVGVFFGGVYVTQDYLSDKLSVRVRAIAAEIASKASQEGSVEE